MGTSDRHPANNGQVMLTAWVPRGLRQAVRDEAKARGLSVSALVEEAVKACLERRTDGRPA